MWLLRGVFGILFLILIAYLMSEGRKNINLRQVLGALVTQLLIGLFLLKTQIGFLLFSKFKDLIIVLTDFAKTGASFVFGEVTTTDYGHVFIVAVVPLIIFISSLSAILYYLKVLPFIIRVMAFVFKKSLRISGLDSLVVSANVFLGQTEAPLLVKPYLPILNRSEIMVMMVSGMATVAGSVLAIYVSYGADAGHLLTASIMSAPASIMFAKIIVPEETTREPEPKEKYALPQKYSGLMDALCAGASDGLKLSLNVVAMLIATISIIYLADYLLGLITGNALSLSTLFGYVFYPLAFILGIEGPDLHHAAIVLGNKIVFNEIVAYQQLFSLEMGEKAVTVLTFAVCGFANISSIAILIGGIGPFAGENKGLVAKLGFKALIAATLSSYVTAILAGLILSV